MRIEALELSFSEQEACDWLAPMLADSGVEALCITFVTGCMELAGRATQPVSVPFTLLLRPRVEGSELWIEIESVQAAGPLGSWLQGPLLALAAKRLAHLGVRQEGRALGVDMAALLGREKRKIYIETLQVEIDNGRLAMSASGNMHVKA
jgi:hypothetical protein